MKDAKIPRSRAKTAYGLLNEVKRLILAEPKRYNQHDRLSIKGGCLDSCIAPDVWPSCETVGCVAGWATVLTTKRPGRIKNVWAFAARKLGLDYQESRELFHAHAAGDTPQSVEHAEAGAAHIARFQQKYATQLKAKRI